MKNRRSSNIGCISQAIRFLKQNIENSKFQFIITEIGDRNYQRNLIGTELYNHKNLIFNNEN